MITGSYTRISLENVRVDIRIGHFGWERAAGKRWPVDVSVDLYTSQTVWPAPDMDSIIDYNRVHTHILQLAEH